MKPYATYHFTTQIKENYGAHDWNGEGECPQYWKFKGGEEYIFIDFPSMSDALKALNEFYININDLYFEYVVKVEELIMADLLGDAYITDDERQQLEHDKKISVYSLRIKYEDHIAKYGTWPEWRLARTRQAKDYMEDRNES